MTTDVISVPHSYAHAIWPLASPFIKRAMERGIADFAEIEQLVLDGSALLWVATDGADILAAAVTQLYNANGKLSCHVNAIGGKDRKRWLSLMLDKIERHATAASCKSVISVGRKGWQRVRPDYNVRGIVLEKALQ